MRDIVFVILLTLSLEALSLKTIDNKIALLKKNKDNIFRDINVTYDPFKKFKKNVTLKKKKQANTMIKKHYPIELITILNGKAFISNRWYKKGDTINGFKIVQIDTDHITLKRGSKKMMLKIKKNSKIIKIVEKNQ